MPAFDMQSADRRVKWLLLIASLVTLALSIAAALEENVFPTWRSTRAAYAEILQQKATDPPGRTIAEQFDLEPDQHVLPALGRVDRCITCHTGIDDARMVDQEQPFCTHPGDFLATHPPTDFGCTICHQGQGLATELPDAHGNMPFWPEPMIPSRYAYAGCGVCHIHVNVPNLATLGQTSNLLERYDCLACHRIDGRGGTLRPGGAGGMEGPDLSHVGTNGFDAQWYHTHLERFEHADSGPWKASFGPVAEDDRHRMESFLATRVGTPEFVEAKSAFYTLGCLGCHKVRSIGGEDGPDLTQFGEKNPRHMNFAHVSGEQSLANWLGHHLRWPASVVPGSQMPALGLSDEHIDKLTLYLLSLREIDLPDRFLPKDRILAGRFGRREFATDGSTLYTTFCSACHGAEGQGRRYPDSIPFPAIANADFLAVADDAFVAQSIRGGRPGRRMPAWNENEGGLSEEEIASIVDHLRQLGGVGRPEVEATEHRWVDADPKTGERLYFTHCAGCHGPQGEGVDAPQLNNTALLAAAGDTYFIETIARGRRGTAMPGFGRPSPAYGVLSDAEIESIVAFIRTWEEPSK